MATDVDYYSIAFYTPSVTHSALRTYLISNYTDRTVNDCLVLKNEQYTVSLRVHFTGRLIGGTTNVSVGKVYVYMYSTVIKCGLRFNFTVCNYAVYYCSNCIFLVTNYLQDATFKQQGNQFTVQCKVANSDALIACKVTVEATSFMDRSITVLSTVTVQGSNVTLLLPRKSGEYSTRVTAVDALGASVEEFSFVHDFTLTEETVEEENAESNTTGTSEVCRSSICMC